MEPQFLPSCHGPLFALRIRPAGTARRRLLIVPPLVEELNKTRRVLALLARAAAAADCEVLWPDLLGTGDSAGGLEDAAWSVWVDNLRAAVAAFDDGALPLDILAVRAGALLLPGLLAELGTPVATVVLWQPVLSGETYLKQLLRLRSVSARIAGRDEPVKALLEQLTAGVALEVGGYCLSPLLATDLQRANLSAADLAVAGRVELIEFKRGDAAIHSVPMQNFLEAAEAAGIASAGTVVDAEAFWATQEIAAPEAAVTTTLRCLA